MKIVVKANVSYEYTIDVPSNIVKSDSPIPLLSACLHARNAEYDFSKTETHIEYAYDANTGEIVLG